MQTIECPFCRKNTTEVRDTRDGLIVIACRQCNSRYSRDFGRSAYSNGMKYDEEWGEVRYNKGDYYDDYSKKPIKVDPADIARLKEQTALTAALNAEKKIAADRHAADMERQKLLNILKDTGLDQPLD